MAIFTPEELASMSRPTNVPDAIAKGAINGLCRAAPVLAGYGLLTGNLPAVAFGTGGSIACGLPLFPVTPSFPPDTIPFPGGQCDIFYNVRVRLLNHNLDCSVANNIDAVQVARGPITYGTEFVNEQKYECRATPSAVIKAFYLTGTGDKIDIGNYSPDVGGFASISVSPRDGNLDNCGNTPTSFPPLPPGVIVPPGYPDAPYIPGQRGTEPIYEPGAPDDKPPRYIPWGFPNIPLPIPIFVQPTLSVPINAPINIPVSIDVPVSLGFSPTVNVQLDQDGNIRTPPDLLCECNYLPPKPVGSTPPLTQVYSIPYYDCRPGSGRLRFANLEVLPESVPSGLLESLVSSADLAETACELFHPQQEPESLLYSGVFQGVLVQPWYSPPLPPEVVSVELRIVEFSEQDFREITTFPGAGQYKFGSFEFALAGSNASTTPNFVWDRKTYLRLPERLKPGRLRVLLRPGVSFEIWDTGERR